MKMLKIRQRPHIDAPMIIRVRRLLKTRKQKPTTNNNTSNRPKRARNLNSLLIISRSCETRTSPLEAAWASK